MALKDLNDQLTCRPNKKVRKGKLYCKQNYCCSIILDASGLVGSVTPGSPLEASEPAQLLDVWSSRHRMGKIQERRVSVNWTSDGIAVVSLIYPNFPLKLSGTVSYATFLSNGPLVRRFFSLFNCGRGTRSWVAVATSSLGSSFNASSKDKLIFKVSAIILNQIKAPVDLVLFGFLLGYHNVRWCSYFSFPYFKKRTDACNFVLFNREWNQWRNAFAHIGDIWFDVAVDIAKII